MDNLMQPFSLRVSEIIDHAARYHPNRKIISRNIEGPIIETSWIKIYKNSKKLSKALIKLGINKGDRIGVMAWNTARHLEIWYGIPGSGAINHTLNPRLFSQQLTYIINHAEDKILIIDYDLLPIVEQIISSCKTVQNIIVISDLNHMPKSTIPDIICYEELLKEQDEDFEWIKGDEKEACGICYTSGTTGNPKGVLYSHRSTLLHTWAGSSANGMGLSADDSILMVVPMFHVMGWGLPYIGAMNGIKLVLPGMGMDGAALVELIEKENRIDFWIGIGTATWSVAIISTVIGYIASDFLNKDILIGLAIINPIYFTCMMLGAMKTIQISLSVVLGAILGPAFYFFSPEWCILFGGFIAGTVAFLIGESKWPIYLVVILVTSFATYLSRFLGVVSAEKIKETSKMFRWFNCLAYSTLAALIARIVIFHQDL